MKSYVNKNCLVTGSTGGLGIEIVKEMSRNGANLFLTGRDEAKLNALQKQLEGSSFIKKADFNNLEDINGLIKEVSAKMRIDILINCAGVFPVKSIDESTLEDYEECFNINVRAPFLLTKAFSKGMADRKWGRIVNIGSSSAYGGFTNTSLYCSSKHALLGFSRSAFSELKNSNVRVFCISPASIKTKMGESVPNQNFETFIDPAEVAQCVNFFISFEGNMVSEEVRLNRMSVQ